MITGHTTSSMSSKDWEVRHCRAWPWFPAYIRKVPGLGHVLGGHWIRWGKYTRISYWHDGLGRYRTWHTCLGWVSLEDVKPEQKS